VAFSADRINTREPISGTPLAKSKRDEEKNTGSHDIGADSALMKNKELPTTATTNFQDWNT